jgi:radical SAM superfamily enzyme YgiQ (UPF0313 family)/glycosyltransferase involved in cell wall biosynthesis
VNYLVVLIATRWGSELGGINVFNTGLALGIAGALHSEGACVCFLEELPNDKPSIPHNIQIFVGRDRDQIIESIESNYFEVTPPREVLFIGHDIKTGSLAIECARHLVKKAQVQSNSAVISHMAYTEYAHYKGVNSNEVTQRRREQENTVANADFSFAVGPLLQGNFQTARQQGGRDKSRVVMLVPGAPRVKPRPEEETGALRIFVAGRLGSEDDKIKNGKLVIQSLIDAYSKGRPVGGKKWLLRGSLVAFGAEPQTAEFRALLEPASEYFSLEGVPFTTDQEAILDRLSGCHVALMPSWHEGFGLTGWEAICSGVPLVCSRQSGLALFLDELKEENPSLSLESIEIVDIIGHGSDKDRTAVSHALLNTVSHYPARKHAAMSLAKYLTETYTWGACARTILEKIGWALPASVAWEDRKQVGYRHTPAAREEVVDDDRLIAEAIADSDSGHSFRDWETTCSALNAFSNRGKNSTLAIKDQLFKQLRHISVNFERAVDEIAEPQSLRSTGVLDICWRFLAAASSVAQSFGDFSELVGPNMLRLIVEDSFLRRELLFYSTRYSKELDDRSLDLARAYLAPVLAKLKLDPLLQRRLARLCAMHVHLLRLFDDRVSLEAFNAEFETCQRLEQSGWETHAVLSEQPSAGCTLLALSSLRRDPRRQALDSVLAFFEDYQERPVHVSWRGDKRLNAALLSTTLSPSAVFKLLKGMAQDEEESVRWAAVDLMFSRVLRDRLTNCDDENIPRSESQLLAALGAMVDSAVRFDSTHPWLQREFLRLFAREHKAPRKPTGPQNFTLQDFPYSRTLFGDTPDHDKPTALHPEVIAARRGALSTLRRVLLVLPPISLDRTRMRSASTTTTPPLGLGFIASHLSSLGHDVHVVDCHRYPQLAERLVAIAADFDIVGFNVVLSTVSSVLELASAVRRSSSRPLVIVGGPAVALGTWKYSAVTAEHRACWDFEITEPVESNVLALLDCIGTTRPWPTGKGIFANRHSQLVLRRDLSSTALAAPERTGWLPSTPLDRRVFNGPNGLYEPNHTRAAESQIREAHVVMSKGCEWNCAFCTERKAFSGGEVRRPVDSVLQEITELAATHTHLRIQFVDDNLLPQLATIDVTDPVGRAVAIQWTKVFLTALQELAFSRGPSFGWRGIFRFEDFMAYESSFEQGEFIGLLAASGCAMLAFGVEHGSEERRKRLKGQTSISNEQAQLLFSRLASAGIHSKAYFMLGGWNETVESSWETINFAIASNASLAYFALFKDFVPAVSVLKREEVTGANKHSTYLSYREHWPRWDSCFESIPDGVSPAVVHRTCTDELGAIFSESEAQGALDSYRQLKTLGFAFSDLVKYNDYHSEEGPAATVLSSIALGDVPHYFRLVTTAYLRFYLRPEFVATYKKLIAGGY